jgi:hypothetical protein
MGVRPAYIRRAVVRFYHLVLKRESRITAIIGRFQRSDEVSITSSRSKKLSSYRLDSGRSETVNGEKRETHLVRLCTTKYHRIANQWALVQ